MWPGVGLLVLLGGVVWALVAPGWDDYAWSVNVVGADPPLDGAGGVVLMSPAQGLGVVAAALGVVLLAAWAGYRLGRRRSAGRA